MTKNQWFWQFYPQKTAKNDKKGCVFNENH